MNFHQLSERSDILRPMAQKVLRKRFCPIFWVLSYLQCSNERLTHPHLLQGQIPLWLPGWTSDLHGFGQGRIVKIHQNTHPMKSSKDIVPMKSNETLKRFFNSSIPRLTWAVDHFHNLSDQFLGDRYLTANRGEPTRSLVLIKCGNCASIILTRSHKYTTLYYYIALFQIPLKNKFVLGEAEDSADGLYFLHMSTENLKMAKLSHKTAAE